MEPNDGEERAYERKSWQGRLEGPEGWTNWEGLKNSCWICFISAPRQEEKVTGGAGRYRPHSSPRRPTSGRLGRPARFPQVDVQAPFPAFQFRTLVHLRK